MTALRAFFCLLLLTAPASGRDVAAICDEAAAVAARETNVPLNVLRALTRTETGRSQNGELRPWPWTVNMEGEGRWFEDRADALAFVERRRKAGAVSFDIGCFQINHRWHGDAFDTIEEMFEPLANARYAARFLNEIRAEAPQAAADWRRIAGAYHSRTPHYADKYRQRFARIFRNLGDYDAPTRGGERRSLFVARQPLFGPRLASLSAPAEGRAAAAGAASRRGGVGLGALRAAKPFFTPHPAGGG